MVDTVVVIQWLVTVATVPRWLVPATRAQLRDHRLIASLGGYAHSWRTLHPCLRRPFAHQTRHHFPQSRIQTCRPVHPPRMALGKPTVDSISVFLRLTLLLGCMISRKNPSLTRLLSTKSENTWPIHRASCNPPMRKPEAMLLGKLLTQRAKVLSQSPISRVLWV
jgi:hypothetical protein